MNASVRTRNKVLEIIQNNKDISFMDIVNKMKDEMGTKISSSSMDNFIKMIRRVLEWWEESGEIIQTVNRRTKEGKYRMNESSSIAKSLVSDTLEEMGIDVAPHSLKESVELDEALSSNDLAKLKNTKTNAFPTNRTMNYKEKFDWILRNGVKLGDWVGQSLFYYDGNIWMLKSGKATNEGSVKEFRGRVNKSVVDAIEPALSEVEKLAAKGTIKEETVDESIKGIQSIKPNSPDWMTAELQSQVDESAKEIHKKLLRKGVVAPIDSIRHPKRKGLEGPYRSRKSGKVFYYDPKEGKYYDADSDIYLDVDDVMEAAFENRRLERFVNIFYKIHPRIKLNGISKDELEKIADKAMKQGDGGSKSLLLLRTFLKKAGATGMIESVDEKLKPSDGLGAWIKDFMKSDAPQFKGKSDKEKRDMAIAAFTDAGGKLDEAKGILSVKPNSSEWRTAKLNTNKNIEGAKGVTKLKKGDTVDIHPFDGDRYVGAVDKSNQGTYFFLAKYSVNESVHDFDEIRENLRKNLTSQFVDEQRHEDMVDAVNKMSKDELKKLIRDKKNPMAKLAFRRFNRMQNPRKYPSDQLEENTNEFGMLSEENLESDRRDIMMVCGPEFKSVARLNPRQSADFDRMIFLLYSQFSSDVKNARKIDDGWDFTTWIMEKSQSGEIKEKFPKSYFRLIGGKVLENDVVKMGIAEEKESIEESNILVKRGKKFQAGVPKWFGVTMTGLPKYPTQKVAGWKTELETGSGMPGYKSYLLHNDGLGTWTVFADADNTGINPRMSPRGPLGSFKSPEEAMKFVEKAVLKEEAEETLLEGIKDIQDIVRAKIARRLKFKEGGTMKVDMTTANALLTVYDALNDANKKKFEEMLTKSKNTFMKAVDFTWKQVGLKKEGYSWDELMEEKDSKMQDSFKTSSLGRIADTARQILEGKDLGEAKEMYVVATFHKDMDGAAAIGSETSRSGLLKSGVKPEREKKGLYWLTFDNEKNIEKFLEKYRSKIASAHITDKNPKDM